MLDPDAAPQVTQLTLELVLQRPGQHGRAVLRQLEVGRRETEQHIVRIVLDEEIRWRQHPRQ